MQAREELTKLKERLRRQISVLESEMATVDKAIGLLEREHQQSETAGPQDRRFRKLGLSDACRQIVGSEWISPMEVRDHMMNGGYKSDDKAALLASVYVTLKRLAMKELEGRKVDGKMKYRQRQPAAMVAADAA
jgi:hypothetical protein